MSAIFPTAGQPGTPRCSEAATGSSAAPRARKLGAKTTPFPGIPFVTDQAGRKPFRCHLDLPPMRYGDGYRYGLTMAAELAVAAERLDCLPLMAIVREAARELERTQQSCSLETENRRGAAVAILTSLFAGYKGACKTLDHRQWHAEQMQDHDRMQAAADRARADEKAAFVERMRQARATKAAKRQAATTAAGGAEGVAA